MLATSNNTHNITPCSLLPASTSTRTLQSLPAHSNQWIITQQRAKMLSAGPACELGAKKSSLKRHPGGIDETPLPLPHPVRAAGSAVSFHSSITTCFLFACFDIIRQDSKRNKLASEKGKFGFRIFKKVKPRPKSPFEHLVANYRLDLQGAVSSYLSFDDNHP